MAMAILKIRFHLGIYDDLNKGRAMIIPVELSVNSNYMTGCHETIEIQTYQETPFVGLSDEIANHCCVHDYFFSEIAAQVIEAVYIN